MTEGRKTRSLATVAVGMAMAVAASAPAMAATASYPGGGSSFTAGPEGWTGSGASCAPASGLEATCSTTTEHSTAVGNPPGSINSRLDVIVNAGALFKGESTWTSPDFTLPQGTPVRAAAVALDRRLDGSGVPALDPQSTYTVTLIDRTAANKATQVLTETIDQGDAAFARNGGAVPAGALVEGHAYAIVIRTMTTTRTAGVGLLGTLNSRYDNVSLTTDDSAPAAGLTPIGDGAQGTPGVTVRGAPLSDGAFSRLAASINPYAEVGKNAGGSLLAISKCTIVGTAGKDRIKGTKGNDVICGLGGDDRIDGAGGKDIVDTGNGNDIAGGGTSNDVLIGVRGKDRLNGASGADRMGGGASADRLNGGTGNDRLHGGSASDRLVGSSGGDRLAGTAGNDRLDGGKGNDRLTGGKGRDRVAAGAGKDRINIRDGVRDLLDGGTGRDIATVDRRKGVRTSASASRVDSVRRVERVR